MLLLKRDDFFPDFSIYLKNSRNTLVFRQVHYPALSKLGQKEKPDLNNLKNLSWKQSYFDRLTAAGLCVTKFYLFYKESGFRPASKFLFQS